VLCAVHCLPTVVIRGSSPCDMVSANTVAEWFCCHCLHVGHWSCQCLTPHVNCHDTNCILPQWHPNFGDHCPIYDPYLSNCNHRHCCRLRTLACQTAEAAECTLTLKPPTPPPMPGALSEHRPLSPVRAGCVINYDQTGSAYQHTWEAVCTYNPPHTQGDNWSQFSEQH
jgi:hypothetical protein